MSKVRSVAGIGSYLTDAGEDQSIRRLAPSRLPVPMGGADFPGEIYRASRRWAEARYDVRHWSTWDRGGHFAALEYPEAILEDLRGFLGSYA